MFAYSTFKGGPTRDQKAGRTMYIYLVSVPDPFPIFFIRMRNKGGGGERKGSGDTAYPSADPGMSTILICGYYSSVRARVRPLL